MATSIEKTLLSPQRQRQHLPQGKGHSEVKIISYHHHHHHLTHHRWYQSLNETG
jgi:hypothetical protein